MRKPIDAMKVCRLLDRHAALCVEEILESTRRDSGEAWFLVILERMKKLLNEYETTLDD